MERFMMQSSEMQQNNGLYRRIGRRAGWAFFALAALTTGVQMLAGAVVAALYPQMTEYPMWLNWLLSFLPLYGVAFPVFITLLQPLPGIKPPRQKVGFGWLAGTVCAAFALMYAGALAGNGLNWLIGWLRGRPVLSGLEEIVGAAPVWQTVLFACVLAPVGEEITFNCLLEKTLVFGEKRAALFCALAFGMFHGNLYQFFYAFAVRFVLVQLRLRTGSLGLCIGLHALINLVGGVVSQWALGQSEQVMGIYGVLLMMLIVAGWMVLAARRRQQWAAGRPGTRARWLFASPGAVLAWVCCGAMFVLSLVP